MSQLISTHPRIFSDRYLDKKMGHFSLLNLPEFEKKLGLIKEWQVGIASQRILKAKEEQLQDDFLKLFFGEVLGYSYRQDLSTWQLEREYKTVLDGTKADGALGYFSLEKGKLKGLCRAVIELKDARSDLDKPQNRQNDRRTPVQQAFDYASAVGGDCRWVIVSNFLEIRLYHQSDRSRYERFEISQLNDEATLKRFFFLLQANAKKTGFFIPPNISPAIWSSKPWAVGWRPAAKNSAKPTYPNSVPKIMRASRWAKAGSKPIKRFKNTWPFGRAIAWFWPAFVCWTRPVVRGPFSIRFLIISTTKGKK